VSKSSIAVVPAAGKSERFGSMKLLVDVSGEPLLDRTLASLLDAGISRVVIVLAPDAVLAPVTRLHDARVTSVINPDPSRGMFSSIQTGLAAAQGSPILLLPADMPFVSSGTVRAVADACEAQDDVVVPIYQGRRGHPLGLPGRLRDELLAQPVTGNLRDALRTLGVTPIELPVDDAGVLRDVDVKGDLR
jgi:molybdenum cofactor cytidylyltransferase